MSETKKPTLAQIIESAQREVASWPEWMTQVAPSIRPKPLKELEAMKNCYFCNRNLFHNNHVPEPASTTKWIPCPDCDDEGCATC